MASEHITGDMVEVTEFPHLAVRYNVSGVPHTVINEKEHVVGLVPPMEFAQAVLRSLGR